MDYCNRLKKTDWDVRPVDIETARNIVEKYHYAKGASNTATALHGLFKKNEWFGARCYGVAWWIPPTRSAAIASYYLPEAVLSFTWQNHTGLIYKAAGWEYLGLTKPEAIFLYNGRLISRKAGGHTRTRAEMAALGAQYIRSFPKHKFRLIRKVANHDHSYSANFKISR